MSLVYFPSLFTAYRDCMSRLVNEGETVEPRRWQGIDAPAAMCEVIHHGFRAPIPGTMLELKDDIPANLPWAEDHFQERVGGEPLNPGEQYKNWPYYRGNVPQHQTESENQFTHTYMERMWPRYANMQGCREGDIALPHKGIRYNYGSLSDVVRLLADEPDTRQAYLPIWFPEDTGVLHSGRVPCTIGYHFLQRGCFLHCSYFIRSCDAIRHLPDDIYMACRLVQWILTQLKQRDNDEWKDIEPGELMMTFGSLHIWDQERELCRKKFLS